MRKLIGAFVLLAACHGSKPSTQVVPGTVSNPGGLSGAADPATAVRSYMAAVKAQDLQALSLAWGTSTGSARSQMDQDYLEKAEVVVIRCLNHDSFEVIGDAPGLAGRRVFAVAIKRRDLTRTTNFNVVPGPSGRWYVEGVDMEPMQDYCSRK